LIKPNEQRLLSMLRMDLAALLRGYFPVEMARELSEECEALISKRVENGQPIRRIALTPASYARPRHKSDQ
jgi:hypothetical protein